MFRFPLASLTYLEVFHVSIKLFMVFTKLGIL